MEKLLTQTPRSVEGRQRWGPRKSPPPAPQTSWAAFQLGLGCRKTSSLNDPIV